MGEVCWTQVSEIKSSTQVAPIPLSYVKVRQVGAGRMKLSVYHLPSHGTVCRDTWRTLRREDRMSHFLKMPEDPWGLLGSGSPWTTENIEMGLTTPYGEGGLF